MRIERRDDAVVAWAPAKVNLHLEVLAKRADGFHEIATLMVAVSLFDMLEFKDDVGEEICLSCNLPCLATGQENLVVRAAHLLRQHTRSGGGARIKLVKRIPLGGGLGGGSSDAAATLWGLNLLWRTGLSRHQMGGLAAEIGSDIAFFFESPMAWCTGRGEKVLGLQLRNVLWFVLACPPFAVSTAEVYRRVQVPSDPLTGAQVFQMVKEGTVDALGPQLHNRLEPAAFETCPKLADLLGRLASLSPIRFMVSGSGSTLFALCSDYRQACSVAHGLNATEGRMGLRVFIVRSCF
jgi:4-diphosphocytidyl-2-C-methyl-D-erythritol kinase